MSEHHIPQHEHSSEQEISAEAHKNEAERLESARHEASKAVHEHAKKIESIRDTVSEEAKSASEITPKDTDEDHHTTATYWYSKEYREIAFSQLLGKVQKKLNPADRATSKVIHKPIIEKASEIGAKTIARPSGVLFGSIFSFIASLVTYIIARRNGYDMTNSVFFIAFIGGFIVGIGVEYMLKVVRTLLSRS
jgi:hypothetical protein